MPLTAAVSTISGINWYQEDVAKSAADYSQSSRRNRAVFAGLTLQQSAVNLNLVARRAAGFDEADFNYVTGEPQDAGFGRSLLSCSLPDFIADFTQVLPY